MYKTIYGIRKQYAELENLRKKELSPEQIVKDYIPRLYVLRDMGALAELRQELDRLSDYKDTPYHKNLTILLMMADGKYQLAEKIIEDELEKGEHDLNSQLVWCENLVAICLNNGNKVQYDKYIAQLENLVFEQNTSDSKAFDMLMEYYDNHQMDDKIERTIQAVQNVKKTSFREYCDYSNIVYKHYKRAKNYMKCRNIIDEIIREGNKEPDAEQKKKLDILILRDRLDLNYDWQHFSHELYEHRSEYLNCSSDVYFNFLSTVLYIFQQSYEFFRLLYDEQKQTALLDDIAAKGSFYMTEIDKELDCTGNNFLYYKVSLLMNKVEYCRFKEAYEDYPSKYLHERIDLLKQITSLCKENTDKREMMHFINVIIDEIVSVKEGMDMLKYDIGYQEKYENYKLQEKEYVNIARQCLAEMMELLEETGFTHNNSYYILYAAYNYLRLDNSKKAISLFKVYKKLGVDINQYPLTTINIYRELEGLSNNRDIRSIIYLKSDYIYDEIKRMENFINEGNPGAAMRICNLIADRLDLASGKMPKDIKGEVVMTFLNFQASLYFDANRYQSAEAIINQYDAYAHECITTTVTDCNHCLLAIKILEASGKIHKALEYTEKAIRKYRENEDHAFLALLYKCRGGIETKICPESKINSLCEALGEAERVGNQMLSAQIYEELGLMFNVQGKPSLGMSFIRKASAIYCCLKQRPLWLHSMILQTESYHYMEQCAAEDGKMNDAAHCHRRMIETFQMVNRDELDDKEKALHDKLKGEYTQDEKLLRSALNFYISSGAMSEVAYIEDLLGIIR